MNQDALFRAFGSNQALFRYRMVCEVLMLAPTDIRGNLPIYA